MPRKKKRSYAKTRCVDLRSWHNYYLLLNFWPISTLATLHTIFKTSKSPTRSAIASRGARVMASPSFRYYAYEPAHGTASGGLPNPPPSFDPTSANNTNTLIAGDASQPSAVAEREWWEDARYQTPPRDFASEAASAMGVRPRGLDGSPLVFLFFFLLYGDREFSTITRPTPPFTRTSGITAAGADDPAGPSTAGGHDWVGRLNVCLQRSPRCHAG